MNYPLIQRIELPAPRLSMFKIAIGVFLAYSLFLRPTLLHQSFSTLFVVFSLSLLYFALRPKYLAYVFSGFGLYFSTIISFCILYSFVVDYFFSSFSSVSHSMTGYFVRLFVFYLSAAFLSFYVIKGSFRNLDNVLLFVVVIHCVFAVIMIFNPGFKLFMYHDISGYSLDHKVFYSHLYETRTFGWSAGLFYLAPVFLVFYYILFLGSKSKVIYTLVGLALVVLLSVINARLAVVAIPFALIIRFGWISSVIPALAFFFVFFFAYFFFDIGLLNNFFEEFRYGGMRTLNILFEGHVHYLLAGFQNIFGSFYFIYDNPTAPVHSDIGWLILLNYGGWFLFILTLVALWVLCRYAFVDFKDSIACFVFLLLLGVKGVVFNGNAVIALLVCFALMGGYHKSKVKNLRRGA